MAEEKVYTPEVIDENPFPIAEPVFETESESVVGGEYKPTTTKEKNFPRKRIAVELLSSVLNTRSRRILEEFQLQQSGGFKIGDFKEGISGDLRITPNGITARDLAGLITFALNGTTGDAVFKGEIRAGTLVGGEVSVIGGNFVVYDGNGNAVAILGIFE